MDQTCKAQASDFDKFPFPATATATGLLRDVLTTRKLKVAEYAASAHSTVDPATCDDVETTQPESECEGTYVAATPCEISCQCDDDNPACHGVTCWDRCSCSKPSTCTKGDDWSQDGDYTVTPQLDSGLSTPRACFSNSRLSTEPILSSSESGVDGHAPKLCWRGPCT